MRSLAGHNSRSQSVSQGGSGGGSACGGSRRGSESGSRWGGSDQGLGRSLLLVCCLLSTIFNNLNASLLAGDIGGSVSSLTGRRDSGAKLSRIAIDIDAQHNHSNSNRYTSHLYCPIVFAAMTIKNFTTVAVLCRWVAV